eukprot:TRINITY_DN758_c0_g1_i1.p1 TRINITY_DN758_c0_g1~~TRINITY_DN758_c0_g1_i1.p1  ORF type:complete len:536 (+),score=138.01 TRINITY_DN758_c0_g1_i1:219-1826(+)
MEALHVHCCGKGSSRFYTLAKPIVSSSTCQFSIKLSSKPFASQIHYKLVPKKQRHGYKCIGRDPCCHAAVSASSTVQGEEDKLHITETKEPNCRARLNVKVPAKICGECYRETLAELRKTVEVPGFRRGDRVPDQVLTNFVGMENVKTAAIERLFNKTFPEAMSLVEDRALRDSEHIVTKFDALQAAFSPSTALSYDIVVDLAPEVKWTSPEAYKHLKLVVEVESDAAIEKLAEPEFNMRHKDMGSLKIVEGRGIQIGDIAILDVSAVRVMDDGTDGEKLPSTEQKGFQLDTEETGNLVPGFIDAIIGLERGMTKSFTVTFPDSWKEKELQSVHARFNVECKELFYRDLPDLDDTIADNFISGCSTLKQVQESLLTKHKEMAEERKKESIHMGLLKELSKVVDADIPHSLLEEHGRDLYGAKIIQLQTTMKLTKDDIRTLSSAKAVNNYLLSQKEVIKESVKQSLALTEIFKIENLKYSEEEVGKEVEKTVEEFKKYDHEFSRDRIREQAEEVLAAEKVLQWLVENSEIQYIVKD